MNFWWFSPPAGLKLPPSNETCLFFHVRSAAAELAGMVSKLIRWLMALGHGDGPWGLVANAQQWCSICLQQKDHDSPGAPWPSIPESEDSGSQLALGGTALFLWGPSPGGRGCNQSTHPCPWRARVLALGDSGMWSSLAWQTQGSNPPQLPLWGAQAKGAKSLGTWVLNNVNMFSKWEFALCNCSGAPVVLFLKVDVLVIANQLVNTSTMIFFCVCTGIGVGWCLGLQRGKWWKSLHCPSCSSGSSWVNIKSWKSQQAASSSNACGISGEKVPWSVIHHCVGSLLLQVRRPEFLKGWCEQGHLLPPVGRADPAVQLCSGRQDWVCLGGKEKTVC